MEGIRKVKEDFDKSMRDFAKSLLDYHSPGRANYEMVKAICKAKGVRVNEDADEWVKLTAEQREFWEAMAQHDGDIT